AVDADAAGLAASGAFPGGVDGIVDAGDDVVEVAVFASADEAGDVDVGDEADTGVHGDGEGLGAAHAAAARGDADSALEGAVEVLAGALGECFVGALEDSLGADVDPGPGGHQAVHDEALAGELVEVVLGGPVGDEV